MAEGLGLREETGSDGHRPHKFPRGAIGEEVIAWTCLACGEVVREYGQRNPSRCPMDWRGGESQRRLVSKWTAVQPQADGEPQP